MAEKRKKRIYLDYAATTPVDPLVLKAMEPYFITKFGNPNSIHAVGQEALTAVDQARESIAKLCNCSSKEIIFTSGATESNNLAIRGVIKKYNQIIKKPEIITTKIEHPSVLNTCHDIESMGGCVKYLPINKKGIVNIENLKNLVTDSTVLVTIMYVNNEIGTIQQIREVGKALKKINKDRKTPILFHTDAVQAVGLLNSDALYLHVDLMSLSAHKIYGPKGVGALYVKDGTPISGIQTGGDQEYSLRAGTIPVTNIVGFGKAVDIVIKNKETDRKKISQLRDWSYKTIINSVKNIELVGEINETRIANNLYLCANDVNGADIMFLLDTESNISVSTGSACSAGVSESSYVLHAIGLSQKKSQEGLRITLGRKTSKEDMVKFVSSYTRIVKRLRR